MRDARRGQFEVVLVLGFRWDRPVEVKHFLDVLDELEPAQHRVHQLPRAQIDTGGPLGRAG